MNIGERQMTEILSRAIVIALAANVAFVLWASTLAPAAI
jgi:hypothetical protein